MPLGDELMKKAAELSDMAIVVIGRTAGEDQDTRAERRRESFRCEQRREGMRAEKFRYGCKIYRRGRSRRNRQHSGTEYERGLLFIHRRSVSYEGMSF